ncbi:MAG TPA: hypothetical protein DCW86_00010 [Actinobacteria bacterium]|nr:hypothetical protein [Actinomycetota bacterium]
MKRVFVFLVCIALIFVSACAKAPEKKVEVTKEEVATETVEPEEETVPAEEETAVPAPTPAPTPKRETTPSPSPPPVEEMVYISSAGGKYDSFYHKEATCPEVSRNPSYYNRISKSQAEADGWLPHPDCHGCPPNPGDPEVVVIGGSSGGSPYYHSYPNTCGLAALMCKRLIRLNQAKWLGKTPCPTCSPPPPE